MISIDKLERVGDEGSIFVIVFHGHWSEIVRVGDPYDRDHIKWIGSDEYVSDVRGFKYRVLPRSVQTASESR